MIKEDNTTKEDDLPLSIGQPATRALRTAGITTLTQVKHLSDRELLSLHGMGPKAIGILREYIKKKK